MFSIIRIKKPAAGSEEEIIWPECKSVTRVFLRPEMTLGQMCSRIVEVSENYFYPTKKRI